MKLKRKKEIQPKGPKDEAQRGYLEEIPGLTSVLHHILCVMMILFRPRNLPPKIPLQGGGEGGGAERGACLS